jgi:hypothetical protein
LSKGVDIICARLNEDLIYRKINHANRHVRGAVEKDRQAELAPERESAYGDLS